ncbi:unnamed protein product (macronuclear) [Paramecium tetraurelia]|uniref:poly(ADP-ribose) glycohydrolase n=1 Tax=Paramecium tetraurelia TaxID=5888 RepID=A0E0D0_PARTE|nr:uncharacterized protein GSPATT00021915001 [Paramecium tetraurelia]CAK88747.1 unnamed protein product [Paramecium tetraurelia]|eukprot:XP_001456144.1 hypothetical protein (macronuclear) [Paramecium tetraurelia strain d4-2]
MIQKDVNEKMMYQYPTLSEEQKYLLTQLLSQKDLFSSLPLIQTLNGQSKKKLMGLETAILQLDQNLRVLFFQNALPKMAQYSLNLLNSPPKKELLVTQGTIQFTRKEIYQFLSLSFFGLLKIQHDSFPTPCNLHYILQEQPEKAKCYLHYFITANNDLEHELVTLERIDFNVNYHIHQFFPNNQGIQILDIKLWSNCDKNLQKIDFVDTFLEEQQNALIVDFANKYVGGGVLHTGCVQEEILFTIMPENIIAVIFSKVLSNTEVIIIKNTIRYCDYLGYGLSFHFLQRKPSNLNQNILVLDALYYGNYPTLQFQSKFILRDINKAFIGFSLSQSAKEEDFLLPISTGKWGCGAFRGNCELKTLIQLIAFSASRKRIDQKRRMIFSTFEDEQLQFYKRDIDLIIDKFKSVGKLFEQLLKITDQNNVFKQLLGE